MLDIKITRTTSPKEKPQDETKLGFGKKFTDHMFVMDYTEGEGWHDARIVPYAPFPLDPATVVFHYAQEIFEGMKAYRTADDTIQLFRPECNAKRFQDSADRLCIPKIPEEDFVQAVEALVYNYIIFIHRNITVCLHRKMLQSLPLRFPLIRSSLHISHAFYCDCVSVRRKKSC